MFQALQIVAVYLVAVTMSLSLAHALELPGKWRLDKKTYVAVQTIYYPGFTYAGFGEILGIIAMLMLLIATPAGNAAFWWTLAGWICLVTAHGLYWLLIHPMNKLWLKDRQLEGFGGGFFRFDPMNRHGPAEDDGDAWQRARDQWEYSHAVRAVLASVALIATTIAVTS
jgi:anthrone oxygenase-like protein